MTEYKNPLLTVDIIIETTGGIVLIERKNEPHGWALPGGFVDYGESIEDAALREAKEETTLDVKLRCQLHTYSKPERDPRFHTVSVVFVAVAENEPKGADDALQAGVFTKDKVPKAIAFDHKKIIDDYFKWKEKGFQIFNE
ncbi:MAG: NUDIX hydrolase [Deltaproteobacteria bacterium]|nr:NUDIX hydrolase [Deltaproteobacteria bacterium]